MRPTVILVDMSAVVAQWRAAQRHSAVYMTISRCRKIASGAKFCWLFIDLLHGFCCRPHIDLIAFTIWTGFAVIFVSGHKFIGGARRFAKRPIVVAFAAM